MRRFSALSRGVSGPYKRDGGKEVKGQKRRDKDRSRRLERFQEGILNHQAAPGSQRGPRTDPPLNTSEGTDPDPANTLT